MRMLAIMPLILSTALASADDRRWEDEVVYVVITQKFDDGDPANNVMARRYAKDRDKYEGGFWGGDFAGVTRRIDDLADLGATTLLIYPVMKNDERPAGKFLTTGYRPTDLSRVDENFGDLGALKSLVKAAHDRKIKVLLDLPLGFPGFEHPWLVDPAKQDWFGKPTEYGSRRWRVEKPEVADHLIAASKFWKAETHCDGFRLDSIPIHPTAFWKRYAKEVKAADPPGEFLLLGEVALPPKAIGEFLRESGFDSAYDFSCHQAQDVLGKGEDVGKFSFIMKEAREFYPMPRAMVAQVDNYEIPAFVEAANEPKTARTKAAMTFLMTIDRVPLLYPGDELAITVRNPGDAFPQGRREHPFYRDMKALIALRRREPALRRGSFLEIVSKPPIYAYRRELGEDRFLIVLNNSGESTSVRFPIGDRDWKDVRLEDAISDAVEKVAGEDRVIEIRPFGARIFRL